MSIVGTRPPTLDEWNKYELHHRARLDSLLSFESKLEQNYAFASRHPVGVRIFEMLENWNHFVSFGNITYYHARPLDEHQRPYHDFEMMRAPMNVSAHGRYNEVGRSCPDCQGSCQFQISRHTIPSLPCDTCAIAHGYVSLLIIQSKHERGR